MINFALIGAGRIGKMHAEIINANLDATLKFVYDVNSQLANEVADMSNAEVANTPEDAINSSEIDAVRSATFPFILLISRVSTFMVQIPAESYPRYSSRFRPFRIISFALLLPKYPTIPHIVLVI